MLWRKRIIRNNKRRKKRYKKKATNDYCGIQKVFFFKIEFRNKYIIVEIKKTDQQEIMNEVFPEMIALKYTLETVTVIIRRKKKGQHQEKRTANDVNKNISCFVHVNFLYRQISGKRY